MNDSKTSKRNTAKTWTDHVLDFNMKCKLKTIFGFTLKAKLSFLFAELNLSFSLGVVLKNLTKN